MAMLGVVVGVLLGAAPTAGALRQEASGAGPDKERGSTLTSVDNWTLVMGAAEEDFVISRAVRDPNDPAKVTVTFRNIANVPPTADVPFRAVASNSFPAPEGTCFGIVEVFQKNWPETDGPGLLLGDGLAVGGGAAVRAFGSTCFQVLKGGDDHFVRQAIILHDMNRIAPGPDVSPRLRLRPRRPGGASMPRIETQDPIRSPHRQRKVGPNPNDDFVVFNDSPVIMIQDGLTLADVTPGVFGSPGFARVTAVGGEKWQNTRQFETVIVAKCAAADNQEFRYTKVDRHFRAEMTVGATFVATTGSTFQLFTPAVEASVFPTVNGTIDTARQNGPPNHFGANFGPLYHRID